MSRLRACAAVALLASLGAGALHAQPQPAGGMQGIAAGTSAVAVATVESVDLETRKVRLRKESGEIVELVVGPEARNLPQVKPGDRVTAAYEMGMVLAVGPPGTEPARVEDRQTSRTAPGQRPGGRVRQTISVTATVVGIDTVTRIVTLRGPQQIVALPVAADIDLSKLKVGDLVGATYHESVAITVEPAAH